MKVGFAAGLCARLIMEMLEKMDREAQVGPVLTVQLYPALCGVCGDLVPHAFYTPMGKLTSDGTQICAHNNIAYHYEKGRDCWGKKTGHNNFPD